MSDDPTPAPDASGDPRAGRPTLMSYGLFILVGCSLCASLVGSLF